MILFQHPGLGGRRVVIHGFKLDDLTPRCERCGRAFPEKEMGTLTITNQKTGQTEKHFFMPGMRKENRRHKMTTKQYCRYCAFCFQADENEFRCSAEINGQQLYMTRKQINRAKTCPEFALSEMGDVVTGKQYQPKQERQEDNSQPELF